MRTCPEEVIAESYFKDVLQAVLELRPGWSIRPCEPDVQPNVQPNPTINEVAWSGDKSNCQSN